MTEDQRQRWRDALAARGRRGRGTPARRYRQRAGLARLDGPGRVRIPPPARQEDTTMDHDAGDPDQDAEEPAVIIIDGPVGAPPAPRPPVTGRPGRA